MSEQNWARNIRNFLKSSNHQRAIVTLATCDGVSEIVDNSIYTLLKKVTQHDFVRLYFYYLGFLFIKLDILRKLVCLPFH